MERQTQDPTAPAAGSSAGGRLRDEPLADDPLTDDQTPQHAFADAKAKLSELAEYVSYYISAKTDGLKLTMRNIAVFAVLGIVGLIALSAVITTAAVLICVGIAAGLGALFNHLWLGALVTGVVIFALIGLVTWLGVSRLTKSSRARTEQKYVARQQQQRARFGQDVEQRSGSPTK